MEVRVVNPYIAPFMILVKADIYELKYTLDYKLNKQCINRIQQIRRSSSWNLNQTGLVAHGNRRHLKIIEKHTLERI